MPPTLQQPSIVKAQLAKINSRKPSLVAAYNGAGRMHTRQAITLSSSETLLHGPKPSDRPRLASEIKNAGQLLQQLSTRLEAAGFSSRQGSRRPSLAVTDKDTAALD